MTNKQGQKKKEMGRKKRRESKRTGKICMGKMTFHIFPICLPSISIGEVLTLPNESAAGEFVTQGNRSRAYRLQGIILIYNINNIVITVRRNLYILTCNAD